MKRPQYLTTIIISALLFLLPFATAIGLYNRDINQRIDFLEKEISGVKYHRLFTELLFHIHELDKKTVRHDEALYKIKQQIQDIEAIKNEDNFFALKGRWESLRHKVTMRVDYSDSEDRYNDFQERQGINKRILEILLFISNDSNLILDPELEPYHLVNLMVNVIPPLNENLDQLVFHYEEPNENSNYVNIMEIKGQLLSLADLYKNSNYIITNNDPENVSSLVDAKYAILDNLKKLDGKIGSPKNAFDEHDSIMIENIEDLNHSLEKAYHEFSNHLDWHLNERFNRINGFRLKVICSLLMILIASGGCFIYAWRNTLHRHAVEMNNITQAIMNTVLDAIITINQKGTIQTFNTAAEKLFGYKANEVIGKNVNVLMPEPYKSEHDAYLHRHISTGKQKIIGIGREVSAMRKDGTVFPIDLSVNKFQLNEEIMFVGSIHDLTMRKAYETDLLENQENLERIVRARTSELKKALVLAEQGQKAKSDFFANMSHELRTPLNSIIGMTQLIHRDNLDSDAQEMFDLIKVSSENLLNIVNDILDISKIEAGEVRLEQVGFDVIQKLRETYQTMLPIASQKGLSINFSTNKDHMTVIGDPMRLARVATNLISNAINYTPEGKVDVNIITSSSDKPNHMNFRCEIVDTGIGISADKIGDIFKKFTQADSSTTRRFGGTGLGLTITKELVELMGGKIDVTSKINVGSTFWFEIPFHLSEKIEEPKMQIETHIEHLSTARAAADARVLVAEDQEMNQAFIKKLFKRLGIQHYKFVDNGFTVLDEVQQNTYDVVLMDCHMPEMNGYEATKSIRNLNGEAFAALPIIAITADAMPETRDKCLSAGMNGYISKPMKIDSFKAQLAPWIVFADDQTAS